MHRRGASLITGLPSRSFPDTTEDSTKAFEDILVRFAFQGDSGAIKDALQDLVQNLADPQTEPPDEKDLYKRLERLRDGASESNVDFENVLEELVGVKRNGRLVLQNTEDILEEMREIAQREVPDPPHHHLHLSGESPASYRVSVEMQDGNLRNRTSPGGPFDRKPDPIEKPLVDNGKFRRCAEDIGLVIDWRDTFPRISFRNDVDGGGLGGAGR